MSLTNVLQEFGLSENEAKVYLACLELGLANIGEISRKSRVKRTTIYTIIGALKGRGLVSESRKGTKALFSAEDPEKLLKVSEERCGKLKEILPDLKSIYNISDVKPKIRFYEGKEGYVSVYDSIIKDKPKELLVVGSYEHLYQHLDPEYEANWIKQRVEAGIKLRWIDFKTVRTIPMKRQAQKFLREIKFLAPAFSFLSTLFVCNDKTIIVSGKQKEFTALVIENSEFSQMFRQFFEAIWQEAELI